ncbi:NAD(P)/FAD-dependent oxidoreductase [Rubellimicrobium aerolatum]|uniref:NAD(P)/FAD-dependent oxidoreductase n=1 Tax=Rubellimicrobium aerolatum TaxID=490979 RepID=A0ABW0SH04_9RHOB|nr:FAD-dependent monooxygenase [Rubellimicrobium aerolatum]MBP1807538.1 flavin-dependent dehydrogenase [Rubellimicrobium aerolatum]
MRAEVVVVGGGLAGAAAAARLAQAGRKVVLLERTTGAHDKVCGEFLSFEAQEELAALGLDLPALGAVPIGRVAVERGTRRVEAALPFEARSLSRRVLDEALLARAAALGVEVRRGARVTGLVREGAGWAVAVDGGEAVAAWDVMLATGKHDLRGLPRPEGRQDDLLGFKAYWRLDPGGLEGAVELHLFPGGYAGLEMVEGGRANLCLVVRQAAFVALGGRWEALLAHLLAACPGLSARLDRAEPCGRPLAIARIPYGLVRAGSDGLWRLGDQAAVIPSFTGEGMSLALHGARLAAEAMTRGEGPGTFQARLARDVAGQVWRSTWASRAMVTPWGQALAGALTPGLLRGALWATRIPAAARRG